MATFAPGLDGLPLPDGPEKYVSAPTNSRSDETNLVRATLASAEEFEEEADEDGSFLVAALASHSRRGATYGATNAFVPRLHRLSAYLSTGPPSL